MLGAAAHDVLVIADSDVHVRADYLERLVSALEQPGVGLVTTLYAGLPAWRKLPALAGGDTDYARVFAGCGAGSGDGAAGLPWGDDVPAPA